MALPTVSVVMATFRRRDRLERVAASLLDDPGLTELVVVVDGCDDGSLEFLESLARRDRRVAPHWQDNAGASRAQQAGIQRATGDVVLMFDDDQLAGPGLSTGHARHHEAGRHLVVVGAVPTPEPGPGALHIEREYHGWYVDACAAFAEGAPVLDQLWGGNISLQREDMLRVGWANPRFPHRYHYDREFGLRCVRAGLTGVFDPELHAVHEYSRTLADRRREAREQGRALRCLADLYPDLPETDRYRMHDPVGRRMQRLARRRRASTLIAVAAMRGASAAHRVHATRAERALSELMHQVEAQRGAIEEHRRLAAGTPAP